MNPTGKIVWTGLPQEKIIIPLEEEILRQRLFQLKDVAND